VRLAYEQGLLQGRSISPVQRWALIYHMSYQRWFLGEVQESALKNLLFMLDPKRFRDLYVAPEVDLEEEGVPMDSSDIDEIDKYLRNIDEKKSVNAGDLPGEDSPQWGEWQ